MALMCLVATNTANWIYGEEKNNLISQIIKIEFNEDKLIIKRNADIIKILSLTIYDEINNNNIINIIIGDTTLYTCLISECTIAKINNKTIIKLPKEICFNMLQHNENKVMIEMNDYNGKKDLIVEYIFVQYIYRNFLHDFRNDDISENMIYFDYKKILYDF